MAAVSLILTLLASLLHPEPATPEPAPVWPAEGTVTSGFGHTEGRWHPGVDIGILRSPRVRAAVPGRVVLVGEPHGYEGYGNVVVVRSRGYTEVYAHLSTYRDRRGERVRAGERLGTAGCTGACTGTHLHFEVRRSGRPVDPMRVLGATSLH